MELKFKRVKYDLFSRLRDADQESKKRGISWIRVQARSQS